MSQVVDVDDEMTEFASCLGVGHAKIKKREDESTVIWENFVVKIFS